MNERPKVSIHFKPSEYQGEPLCLSINRVRVWMSSFILPYCQSQAPYKNYLGPETHEQ